MPVRANREVANDVAKMTLREIANHLGLHPSTVSRALDPDKASLVNGETRERVKALADEFGYRPDAVAAGLRRRRTNTLGIVVADLANPYIAPVLRGMENNLEGRDKMGLIAETQDNHDRFRRVIDNLLRRQVDAILTTAARTGDEGLLRKASNELPVVLAVRNLPGSGLPAVTHDDERGGRLAADHLHQVAGRTLAQLRGPVDVSSFRERARGFSDRVGELGGELVEVAAAAEHPTATEGRRLMREWLKTVSRLPDGIFAHNDLMALGALDVLQQQGVRVPDDVKIMGYNNLPQTERVEPPMSTLTLPGYEVGRLAADVAVMLIEEPHRDPPAFSLPPRLVARRSTATESDGR